MNAISLACVWGAVLGDKDADDAPVASTMFNVDVTSLQLNKAKPKHAYITAEARRALKKRCQSVSVTKTVPKYRCIKLMTLINAQGDLISTTAILKDSHIPKVALWKVIINPNP